MTSGVPSNGWISTDRRKPVSSPNSTVITEGLPLDWTRMKRKRSDEAECCNDPANCQRRNHRRLSFSPPRSNLKDGDRIYEGHAIFCLHDSSNPSWFQGYFLTPHSPNPWGLLAIQEEIDNCLECESGGYRRLTLKLPSHMETMISGIDWTGGDMMRLSNDKVEMNAQRLLTGKESLPFLEKYFGSLVKQLERECLDGEETQQDQQEESTSILEWLPDIAIVIGPMSIILTDSESKEDLGKKAKNDEQLWND